MYAKMECIVVITALVIAQVILAIVGFNWIVEICLFVPMTAVILLLIILIQKEQNLKENGKLVQAVLVKNSIRYIPRGIMGGEMKTDLTYYDPEADRTYLFHAQCRIPVWKYTELEQEDHIDIPVRYDEEHPKNYMVYLKETLNG